eukprot:5184551-Pleurochrysis_carterae.AAC.2
MWLRRWLQGRSSGQCEARLRTGEAESLVRLLLPALCEPARGDGHHLTKLLLRQGRRPPLSAGPPTLPPTPTPTPPPTLLLDAPQGAMLPLLAELAMATELRKPPAAAVWPPHLSTREHWPRVPFFVGARSLLVRGAGECGETAFGGESWLLGEADSEEGSRL